MAAGLGFKDFTTGEVLTAADVDGYLMQGVWVFADATARDAAVISPQEGNFAYLKDTNVTTYYTGSAWANLDTTGMTNPMTTTGDTIYSSSGSTPARLGIGTAGQVLTVNSGATAPEWATAAAGGMTLISTTTLTGASVTLSSIPATYKDLLIIIRDFRPATDSRNLTMRFNADSNANRHRQIFTLVAGSAASQFDENFVQVSPTVDDTVVSNLSQVYIPDYANATTWKMMSTFGIGVDPTTNTQFRYNASYGFYNQTAAISSLQFLASSASNLTSGSVLLYGVK